MTDKFIQEDLRTSKGTEGSLLIVKKIYDKIIPEADKALLPRQLAALYFGPGDIPGSSIDVDLETANAMKMRRVGEGAEIPLSDPEFTSFNLKPVKWGLRTNITKEMIEDGKWNLINWAAKQAAKRAAENETSLIISDALDSASTTVSGGAALTIANFTEGMQGIEDLDYTPTDSALGSEAVNDLRNIDTFIEANKFGSREMIQRGMVGAFLGVRLWRFSTNAAPSTTYSKYCYIWDRAFGYVIGEKRTLTAMNYKLETHDSEGVAITQRIKVRYLIANAIAKITTS